MRYDSNLGMITAEDLRKAAERSGGKKYFTWRAEYLPVVIGGLGIAAILLYNEIKKERTK